MARVAEQWEDVYSSWWTSLCQRKTTCGPRNQQGEFHLEWFAERQVRKTMHFPHELAYDFADFERCYQQIQVAARTQSEFYSWLGLPRASNRTKGPGTNWWGSHCNATSEHQKIRLVNRACCVVCWIEFIQLKTDVWQNSTFFVASSRVCWEDDKTAKICFQELGHNGWLEQMLFHIWQRIRSKTTGNFFPNVWEGVMSICFLSVHLSVS